LGKISVVPVGLAARADAESEDAQLRALFGHVTTWVFDLDNTLYPPNGGIWDKIN